MQRGAYHPQAALKHSWAKDMPHDAALIARELFACAARAGNSAYKRAHLLDFPAMVLAQAQAIAQGRYQPQALTVFAVTDPKLREIFAPAFADRLVQQWLVRHIEPW